MITFHESVFTAASAERVFSYSSSSCHRIWISLILWLTHVGITYPDVLPRAGADPGGVGKCAQSHLVVNLKEAMDRGKKACWFQKKGQNSSKGSCVFVPSRHCAC